MKQIAEICRSHSGVDGCRSMTACLERQGCRYSQTTIHKYMNTEPELHSVVRPEKPGTKPGRPHKVFENKLKQDFHADRPSQKWCTDFTYLFLSSSPSVFFRQHPFGQISRVAETAELWNSAFFLPIA